MSAVGNDDIVWVADDGVFTSIDTPKTIRVSSPLSWFTSGRFGSVGSSGGLALGAKLCYPDRPVWILSGDGACGYTVMEFDTYSRHNAHVVSLVGNDAQWCDVAAAEIAKFGTNAGCTLKYSHYEKLATVFGARGLRIDHLPSKAELVQQFKEAQSTHVLTGKSMLINVFIDKRETV